MKRRIFLQGIGASGAMLALPRWAHAKEIKFQLHNKIGQRILLNSLNNSNYWNGVDVERPTGLLYDEFKLKKLTEGYLTFISGEGGEDFLLEDVVQTVLNFQNKLPNHMAGAKAMRYIARGIDPDFGVPYTDMLFLGDMDLFYCEYLQRMYRYDLPGNVTICVFEKLTKELAGDKLWAKYEEVKKETLDKADLRWPILNDIVPVTDVYGMYIIAPGDKRTMRVTLTAKLRFGDGTGFLAQWGSELPYLVRSGTLNGFDASVAVAKGVKSGEYKL